MVGRRERKKLATRKALSEAALNLSVQHGVDQVTVEQIADAADVSLRTFFNYFSSKEQAVVAGDAVAVETMVDTLHARPADEPVMDSLRHAALALAAEIPHRQRLEQLRLVRATPSLLPHQLAAYETLERSLAVAIATRTHTDIDHNLYPTLVAASVVAALRVAVQRWLTTATSTGPDGLPELIESALDQLGHGLSSPSPAVLPGR